MRSLIYVALLLLLCGLTLSQEHDSTVTSILTSNVAQKELEVDVTKNTSSKGPVYKHDDVISTTPAEKLTPPTSQVVDTTTNAKTLFTNEATSTIIEPRTTIATETEKSKTITPTDSTPVSPALITRINAAKASYLKMISTPPTLQTWNVTDDKNVTCILTQFKAQFNVTYMTKDMKMNSVLLSLLNNTFYLSGHCGDNEQFITIGWPSAQLNDNTLAMVFARNATTDKKYSLKQFNVSFILDEMVYPNASSNSSVKLYTNASEWHVNVGASYKCINPPEIHLISSKSTLLNATLTLTQVHEEAFRTGKDSNFSAAIDCISSTSDVVPVVVGCVLGIAVIVVLVAYFFGRRRSRNPGYVSM